MVMGGYTSLYVVIHGCRRFLEVNMIIHVIGGDRWSWMVIHGYRWLLVVIAWLYSVMDIYTLL